VSLSNHKHDFPKGFKLPAGLRFRLAQYPYAHNPVAARLYKKLLPFRDSSE
jgi:hypothetical protein